MVLAATDDEQAARLYRTREEQREVGLRHEITPWLIMNGLAEYEWDQSQYSIQNQTFLDRTENTATNVQLGFEITPLEDVKAEWIAEYDSDINKWKTDEATIAYEFGPWEWVAGKQNMPFGVFISHFATGPILEFGEVNDKGVSLTYDYHEMIDVSFTFYRGVAYHVGEDRDMDWTFALEYWPTEDFSIGMSYLSDLADADDYLLEDNGNQYHHKVPGLSAYLLWVFDTAEISLEHVGSSGSFEELDADRNKPMAWNAEFTYFFLPSMDATLRVEGSHELEDEPILQAGISLSYRLYRYASLTVEFLNGRFKPGLATDENDESYNRVKTVAAQLSVAF
ncbi:MAG: hypothetical protein OQL09_06250 [Gammaproteobacteria bacterium]|nr:hypothetical protein [Gammaproteobacteria bacterium]